MRSMVSQAPPEVKNSGITVATTRSRRRAANLFAPGFGHSLTPTGNPVIEHPLIGNGLRVYQELFQSAVGLAGAAGNFDGNGRYLRSSAGGGTLLVQTPTVPGSGPLFGNAILPPLGARPAFPGNAPPLRRDVPCSANPQPNLNRVSTGAGP